MSRPIAPAARPQPDALMLSLAGIHPSSVSALSALHDPIGTIFYHPSPYRADTWIAGAVNGATIGLDATPCVHVHGSPVAHAAPAVIVGMDGNGQTIGLTLDELLYVLTHVYIRDATGPLMYDIAFPDDAGNGT